MTNADPTAPGFRDAGVGDLVKDVTRIGPAPNPSREAFVTVVNVALAALLTAIIGPEPLGIAVIAAVVGLFTIARWAVGLGRWG